MLLISFAWTADALLAGAKITTRRKWGGEYAKRFRNAYKEGESIAAWDRLPRVGGKQIGILRLTAELFNQRAGLMVEQDYIDEGLAWMEEHGLSILNMTPRQFFDEWKRANEEVWVVRFKLET